LILLLISPSSIYWQLLAFALFRFFDAVKPGPIGWIDRYFKTLEGNTSDAPSSHFEIWWRGFGIVVDDLAAAFFTLIAFALVQITLKQFS